MSFYCHCGKIDEWKTQTLLLMKAVRSLNNEKVKLLIFGPVSDAIREKFNQLYDEKFMRYVSWADTTAAYDYFAIADLGSFSGKTFCLLGTGRRTGKSYDL